MITEKTQKKTDNPDFDVKTVVEFMKTTFFEFGEDAERSSCLLDLNIHDTFSQAVDEMLKNPIETGYKALKSQETFMVELINETVKSFILSHSELIKNGYRLSVNNNIIFYSIILKEDNLSNRSVFNRFMTSYEKRVYANRFPIVIQNIPPQLEEDFQKEIFGKQYEVVI